MPPYSTSAPEAVINPESWSGCGYQVPEMSMPAGRLVWPEKSRPCPQTSAAIRRKLNAKRFMSTSPDWQFGDWLFCRTWRRIPASCIGKLAIMRRRLKRAGEIYGIFQSSGDDKIGCAIGLIHSIEVFGEYCVSAIRYAVLAQISRLQMRGDNFQRTYRSGAAARGHHLPKRFRESLPSSDRDRRRR